MDALPLVLIFIAIIAIFGFFLSHRIFEPTAERKIEVVPPRDSNGDKVVPLDVSESEHPASTTRSSGLSFLPERFVFVDLETTGLSQEMDEIIEFGAIRVNRDQTNHATFSTLVRPDKAVPRLITEITGITQKMVDDEGIPLAEALSGFVEFIGDLPIVTFNAEFDMGFIWNAAKRQGLVIDNRFACALKMARRAWPGLPSYRLVDLARMGNLHGGNAHRALGDCERALIVFASAVAAVGEDIRWSSRPRDWREEVKYNAARNANRAFVADTRPLEVSDPALAVTRYTEAMGKMYEYERLIAGRWGDDHLLYRLTLCLWKMGRYQELIDCVEHFTGRFPEVKSTIMVGVLKRKAKAACKLSATAHLAN